MKTYGQDATSPTVCPGEANCQKWASAKGKTRTDKERNVCHPCEMFPTKLNAGKNHKVCGRLTDNAMQIRRERLSGYPRPIHRMSTFEFETFMIVEQVAQQEDMAFKAKLSYAVMAMAGMN